jgi:hypothetical protein
MILSKIPNAWSRRLPVRCCYSNSGIIRSWYPYSTLRRRAAFGGHVGTRGSGAGDMTTGCGARHVVDPGI